MHSSGTKTCYKECQSQSTHSWSRSSLSQPCLGLPMHSGWQNPCEKCWRLWCMQLFTNRGTQIHTLGKLWKTIQLRRDAFESFLHSFTTHAAIQAWSTLRAQTSSDQRKRWRIVAFSFFAFTDHQWLYRLKWISWDSGVTLEQWSRNVLIYISGNSLPKNVQHIAKSKERSKSRKASVKTSCQSPVTPLGHSWSWCRFDLRIDSL